MPRKPSKSHQPRRPRIPKPPPSTVGSRNIDLLVSALTKLNIQIHRPEPSVLAGIVDGLLEIDKMLFAEIHGEETGDITLQIQSVRTFPEERLKEMREQVARIRNLPECREGDARWMTPAVTVPRVTGDRHLLFVATIKAPGGELTAEICEGKVNVLVELIRREWPL